jgi:hypothetical protein
MNYKRVSGRDKKRTERRTTMSIAPAGQRPVNGEQLRQELQSWFMEHYKHLDESLIYKEAGAKQIMFVRDRVIPVTCRGYADYKEWREKTCFVISTHSSKSCDLPVFSIEPPGKAIRFVMRDNFYNWKVSVIADRDIDINPEGLFRAMPPAAPGYSGDTLASVYFEGFPKDLIFGYYNDAMDAYQVGEQFKFSAELGSDYQLWTFVFLCMQNYEADLWVKQRVERDEETKRRAKAYAERGRST